MRDSVSYTAQYGDLTRGPRVIDDMVRENLWEVLGEIQDGTFAKEWILENQADRPVFNALKRKDREHPIELVGRELRKMMPWL
jgi:ketol-acid reductoisomerase